MCTWYPLGSVVTAIGTDGSVSCPSENRLATTVGNSKRAIPLETVRPLGADRTCDIKAIRHPSSRECAMHSIHTGARKIAGRARETLFISVVSHCVVRVADSGNLKSSL